MKIRKIMEGKKWLISNRDPWTPIPVLPPIVLPSLGPSLTCKMRSGRNSQQITVAIDGKDTMPAVTFCDPQDPVTV